MKRPDVKVKGYRWAEFDQEVVAFLWALEVGNHGGPHPVRTHHGRVRLAPNPERFALAIVAASVSFPARFLVTLLVDCLLNEAAAETAPEYVDTVRPFLVLDGGLDPQWTPFGFLTDFFRGRGPSPRALADATTCLAMEWASRNSLIFDPHFVTHVLGDLARLAPGENPFRAGFEKALGDFRRDMEEGEPQ
jgi:hypothetical protein